MQLISAKMQLYPAAAVAKLLQSCSTLCDPIDGSPPGSSVPGILQARTLKWVAISFSNACMHAKSLQSCSTLCDPRDSSPPRLLCPRDSPGKNTGVGCHFLLHFLGQNSLCIMFSSASSVFIPLGVASSRALVTGDNGLNLGVFTGFCALPRSPS